MRRPETALLHGPWPDASPTPDDLELASMAIEFAGRWVIWRALDAQRTPGAWCARRVDLFKAPAGVTAVDAQDLRVLLKSAEREADG